MILKIVLLSTLVSFAIWKIRAKRRWNVLRNYRQAEAVGRLRLMEGK